MKGTKHVRRLALFLVTLTVLGVGLHSLSLRRASLAPDAANYMSVAGNFLESGHLRQSALGYNYPDYPRSDDALGGLTSQPPGFPLILAIVMSLGFAGIGSAILVGSFSHAWIALLCAGWASRASGRRGLLLGGVFGLSIPALATNTAGCLADNVATALAITSFVALLSIGNGAPTGAAHHRKLLIAAAGALAGAAFATAYVHGLLLPYGILAISLLARNGRARVTTGAAYVAGWLVAGAPVLVRNHLLTGSLLGASRPQSESAFLENLESGLRSSLGRLWYDGSTDLQIILAGVLMFVSLVLAFRGRFLGATRANSLPGILLLGAAACYLLALVTLRSVYHFDSLGQRLLTPVTVFLMFFFAGQVASLEFRWSGTIVRVVCAFLVVVSVHRLTADIRWAKPPTQTELLDGILGLDPESAVELSQRLRESPNPISTLAPYLSLRFGVDTIALQPAPWKEHLTASRARYLTREFGSKPGGLTLVIPAVQNSKVAMRTAFGDFLASLVASAECSDTGARDAGVVGRLLLVRVRPSHSGQSRAIGVHEHRFAAGIFSPTEVMCIVR